MPYYNNAYGFPEYAPPQFGQSFPQAPKTYVYAFVKGVEGAKQYPVGAGQSVLLMDADSPIAYRKDANAMGQATIKCFRLQEISEQDAIKISTPETPAYATKEDFDSLNAKVSELLKKMGDK